MDWSGVDYCDVLSAVWTLVLTAPIHCRRSCNAAFLQICSNEETHSSTCIASGCFSFHIGWTVSSSLTSWEGETATRVWIPTLGHSQCDGSVNVNNSADITLIWSIMRARDITTSPSYPGLWTISRSTLTASSLLMFSKLISFTYNKTSTLRNHKRPAWSGYLTV